MQHVDIATYVGIAGGLLALVWAAVLVSRIMRLPTGSARMGEIADAVREGAESFMKRQYGTIGLVALAITVVLLAGGLVTGDPGW
jgi:K(+)-stimulated pyrophosphate-energized sodium pump